MEPPRNYFRPYKFLQLMEVYIKITKLQNIALPASQLKIIKKI